MIDISGIALQRRDILHRNYTESQRMQAISQRQYQEQITQRDHGPLSGLVQKANSPYIGKTNVTKSVECGLADYADQGAVSYQALIAACLNASEYESENGTAIQEFIREELSANSGSKYIYRETDPIENYGIPKIKRVLKLKPEWRHLET